MDKIQKIWKYPDPIPGGALSGMEDFRSIERQVLYSRGIEERGQALKFLSGDYGEVHDPFALLQMDRAVERIKRAINRREPIVIYGDYDADGVSSAALLYAGIKELGGRVATYFPDRFTEGYGLNSGAIDFLAGEGCALIITVDCGVRAYQEARHARERGIDLIITDHHYPGEVLPEAYALINPKQPGDEYPFKSLAGVGVAKKLMQAIRSTYGIADDESDLDLVAIGTVADIVPLVGENRVLVRRGIELLNQTGRIGLQGLIKVAGYQGGTIDSTAIGFALGPRINAAGRLRSAEMAFELLVSEDLHRADVLAEQLDQINRERQEMMHEVVERALAQHEMQTDRGNVIIDFDEDYHEGVIGLAASKLTEAFYRPSIVGRLQEDWITASARSIPGFHMTRALESAGDLMDRFGGHAAAAGLRIHRSKIHQLKAILEDEFDDQMADETLQPALDIDGIATFKELDDRMLYFHDKLAPFGAANPRPLLVSKNVNVLSKRTVGREGAHLKLRLEQNGKPYDAIAFRMGDRLSELKSEIDVAYRLERNHYLGFTTLQLNVVDFCSPD